MAIASPCTSICSIDPKTGLCLGCGRTLDEIAEWSEADEARRAMIVALAKLRRA